MREGIERMIRETADRRSVDAARYVAMDRDQCMMCGAHGADKRSLRIDCGYAVHEVVPEAIDLFDIEGERGYYLLICKACRAALLGHMQQWREERIARRGLPMDHDGNDVWIEDERNIPVRVNGTIMMMTESEYEAYLMGAREGA